MFARTAIISPLFAVALAASSPVLAQSQSSLADAQTKLADPAPTMDKPRRIVLQLNTDDRKAINTLLNNAINLEEVLRRG